jgi:hypothetical protein
MRTLLLAAVLVITSCSQEKTLEKPVASEAPVPAHYETEAEARPLPPTMSAQLFSDPRVSRVYEIAARIPAVLAQQPCYCYCDRGHGHRSLLDCQRDNHSAGCSVCRKEVLLADRMTRMGLTAKEIRAAIIRGDWKQVAE